MPTRLRSMRGRQDHLLQRGIKGAVSLVQDFATRTAQKEPVRLHNCIGCVEEDAAGPRRPERPLGALALSEQALASSCGPTPLSGLSARHVAAWRATR
jgi:hypothetical protein